MLSHLQTRKFIKLFTIYDRDNSGYLGLEDFEQFVQNLAAAGHLRPHDGPYNALLKQYAYRWTLLNSGDRSGKVDLHGWLTYCDRVLQDERKYHQEIDPIIRLLFDGFDRDRTGHISQAQWRDLAWSLRCHSIYAREVFQSLDQDSDGKLSREEFAIAFQTFYRSDRPDDPSNRLLGPI